MPIHLGILDISPKLVSYLPVLGGRLVNWHHGGQTNLGDHEGILGLVQRISLFHRLHLRGTGGHNPRFADLPLPVRIGADVVVQLALKEPPPTSTL